MSAHSTRMTQAEAMQIAEQDSTYCENARAVIAKRARREISPWLTNQILTWQRRSAVRRAIAERTEANFRVGRTFNAIGAAPGWLKNA